MEQKIHQEAPMISAHGNNSFILAVLMCLITITFLLGGIVSERRARIKLYEKKYAKTLTYLQEQNQQLKEEFSITQ